MKISIITVTKNNKAGLLRAIESVRSQTYKNVEHIVVDGLSTDGTAELIKNLAYRQTGFEFRIKNDENNQESSRTDVSLPNEGKAFLPKVSDIKISLPTSRGRNDRTKDEEAKIYNLLFISEADSGIYDAINKGIKLATGDIIGLLHSDDFYANEFVLERYAKAFQDKSLKGNDESILSSRTNVNLPTEDKSCLPMVEDIKISPPTSRVRNDRTQDDKGHTQDYQSPSTNNLQPNIDAVYSDLVYVRRQWEVGDGKTGVGKEKNISHHPTPNTLYPIPYTIIRTWKTQERDFTTEAQRNREILNGWMPPHPTLFLRKEVFDKYGLYRTDMKIAADYEMILRLFFKYKITARYLPLTTYCMTIGGASNKSLKNILIKSSEDYKAMKLHKIPFPVKALIFKNLRKLPQFFR
jgi:glycosyltransferase involved in cell wall biosynthesis